MAFVGGFVDSRNQLVVVSASGHQSGCFSPAQSGAPEWLREVTSSFRGKLSTLLHLPARKLDQATPKLQQPRNCTTHRPLTQPHDTTTNRHHDAHFDHQARPPGAAVPHLCDNRPRHGSRRHRRPAQDRRPGVRAPHMTQDVASLGMGTLWEVGMGGTGARACSITIIEPPRAS